MDLTPAIARRVLVLWADIETDSQVILLALPPLVFDCFQSKSPRENSRFYVSKKSPSLVSNPDGICLEV